MNCLTALANRNLRETILYVDELSHPETRISFGSVALVGLVRIPLAFSPASPLLFCSGTNSGFVRNCL